MATARASDYREVREGDRVVVAFHALAQAPEEREKHHLAAHLVDASESLTVHGPDGRELPNERERLVRVAAALRSYAADQS